MTSLRDAPLNALRLRDPDLVKGLGRAAGGAFVFAIPILMTMEMWSLGHAADPIRLAVLLGLTPCVLIGLAHYVGFRRSSRLIDHLADSLVAIGVAAVVAALFLALSGLIAPGMGSREIIGRIAIQIVPASFGAMLSRSQLGTDTDRAEARRRSQPSYGGELFLMFAGALFLSLSVAPTEEVLLIAHSMTPWQEAALLLASIVIMHAFVYFVEFREPVHHEPGATAAGLFFRFTVTGYVLVLATSLFLLWVFGRVDALGLSELPGAVVVLAFPGAIGAATARAVL